jgi:hypothetical protein
VTASTALRALREAIVLEHLESENEREFGAALDVFDNPRCEIVATGEVFDGAEEFAGYYARLGAEFPDRRSRILELHHADCAVIVEVELEGSRPEGGGPFRVRMTAFFVFDGASLVGKRVYGGRLGPEPALA